ncbi:VOC family protein [Lederbergia wuyishanensis]|uniref:Catechol 2,3-dioxygenase-like lactoylglutathione lyase family enzyme n=1 Tax=Lederbergia wuyishanensis TaxID=1347903 RepID=A0ABU0D8I6_9BACI|nr:VOC family protein [Lederbergia wuyishanensis]MCJ8009174.1 VOC family protein [Lederbergia wuyishanensis]MDQ0344697.1 catechol 2,3-dioxygenase-like lactoylglutathione lyase family enzyme [Lederbergia wuyishanensis]
MSEQIVETRLDGKMKAIPDLQYDGSSIDVLYDYHEEAIKWYENHLGWKVEQKEDWKVDPRVVQGKMTHMGYGAWLVSYIANERLPFHFAERGTVDSNVRLCFKARDLDKAHSGFSTNGIRVSDIYDGPGGHRYFDAWVTLEGIKFTFQNELENSLVAFPHCDNFRDTCVFIGVSNLEKSVEWYKHFVGMEVESEYIEDGYVIMSLGVNHHPDGKSKWILVTLPENAYVGKVDGAVRPMCFIHNRDEFFEYHRFLKANGVEVGEIGGFTGRGMSMFHFYDLDGNRFNVSCFV